MFGDGGGTAAIEPEGFARFGGNRDKAFAVAGLRQLHDTVGRFNHGGFVVADNIGNQHHFRAAFAGGFGGVADCAHITPVEVFQARQFYAVVAEQIIADFNDRRGGVGHRAEEFQTNGADVFGHGVQHKRAAGDDAVGAFFLHTGQAA